MLVQMHENPKDGKDGKNPINITGNQSAASAVNFDNPVTEGISGIHKDIITKRYKTYNNGSVLEAESINQDQRTISQYSQNMNGVSARKATIADSSYIDNEFFVDSHHHVYQVSYESKIFNQHELDVNSLAFLEKVIAPYNLFDLQKDEILKPIEICLSEVVFPNIVNEIKTADKNKIDDFHKILGSTNNELNLRRFKFFYSPHHFGIYEELTPNKSAVVYAIRPDAMNDSWFNFNKSNKNTFLNNLYFYNEYETQNTPQGSNVVIKCKILYVKNGKFIDVGLKKYKYTFYKNERGESPNLIIKLAQYLAHQEADK